MTYGALVMLGSMILPQSTAETKFQEKFILGQKGVKMMQSIQMSHKKGFYCNKDDILTFTSGWDILPGNYRISRTKNCSKGHSI